jgi:hypothetical protein
MASEYLSRRELAAAKVKHLPPSEAETCKALQRLIEGKLDSRWYVDLRRARSEDKASSPPAGLA